MKFALLSINFLFISFWNVKATDRPNFLFMLADDWGWADVSAYRPGMPWYLTGTEVMTPNLDALAANGTLFTDFHAGQAFCAPSRTSFMTGRWPADLRVNVNWNVSPHGAQPNHDAGLPYQLPLPSGLGPSPYPGGLPNVAHVLQSSGYSTGHFGKWHLGGLSPPGEFTPKPSDYGFDITATYGSPIWANESLVDDKNRLCGSPSNPWWSADVGDYIRDQGIEFMKNSTAEGKPFYLQLWWHMSHDTIDPRPEQIQAFPQNTTCFAIAKEAGQTICPSQIYWGAQTWSDQHRFGPVIAAVDELGIRNNTYIIFSTDNGAQTSKYQNAVGAVFDNAKGMNGPFRGSKASLYDGGHRVPFIVSGPGVPKGRVDHSLLSAVDHLPTIAALANASIPQGTLLRGLDVSDTWHGIRTNVINRTKPLLWRSAGQPGPCWARAPNLAIRNGDFKLLLNPDYSAPANQSVRHPRVELYNMSLKQLGTEALHGSFFESQNIAAAHDDVVKEMASLLLDWHHSIPPERPGSTDAQISASLLGCDAWILPTSASP